MFMSCDKITITQPSPLIVVSVAEQGMPGAAGLGAISKDFGFGDSTPDIIVVANENDVVYGVEIVIMTPFDGTGAALTIGDSVQNDRLMQSTQNDPATPATYGAIPDYKYSAVTPINLYISPGAGATQGAGFILIYK